MSLRNQPYFPLYVQDYLTDEKLNECSAQTQGVYIKLMCLMHKSDYYGKILLKQKDKQNSNQILNFAEKLIRHLPFKAHIIMSSIAELVEEKVLFIEDDYLCQKRMIKDNDLSIKRAKAGKKGGKITQNKKSFVKANNKASTESENVIENKDVIHIEEAYEFLKIKLPQQIEIFEMQNKKSFNNYNHFVKTFNYKVIEEKTDWEVEILLARLYRLKMNWNMTPKNKNQKPPTAEENLNKALGIK